MTDNLPVFSIIIPSYARPRQLSECLAAMSRLDYAPGYFEVIVVDDGSDQPPKDIVNAFGGRLDCSLVLQKHAGPATARNTGAANARGEFLAFIDDDCMPEPGWLKALAARFRQARDCAIGGRVINTLSANLYSTVSQQLIDYLYAYFNVDPYRARFFTSNNIAVPADCFRQMGGFNSFFQFAAAEDRDFCDRWVFHGGRMIYEPQAIVYHAHALTLPKFLRQHFNYGRGAFHFHLLRARRTRARLRLEPASFYWGLLVHPFKTAPNWHTRLLLAWLTLLSQAGNAAGYLWEGGYEKQAG